MFKARLFDKKLLKPFLSVPRKLSGEGWASSTPNRAPSKHKLMRGMSYARKKFLREKRKLLDGKLHRQKPGTKEKLCVKTKTKVFACSLGERAKEERKDFHNFLQQIEKFSRTFKGEKTFSISGCLPSPSRELSREVILSENRGETVEEWSFMMRLLSSQSREARVSQAAHGKAA